jgi:phospholipase/carboxylesterase
MTHTPALLDGIEFENAPNPTASLIVLHGLGADGNDFVPIAESLSLDEIGAVRCVFPHAPVRPVTINGGMAMRAWYDIRQSDLGREEDEAGLRESQAQIEALIARERERCGPASRIVLMGISQGCAMTLHTGLRSTFKLAGLMGLSGYLPLIDMADSERPTANVDTPIFLAHGTHDPVVTLERAEASRAKLAALGYAVQWHTYPMQHSVCPEEIHDISRFLQSVLI